MKIEDYKEATNRAIRCLVKFFKPKEILVLYDFVQTVTQKDIDEIALEGKDDDK